MQKNVFVYIRYLLCIYKKLESQKDTILENAMYNNQFYFDEMQQTGNTIRMQNKIKAKNLMSLSVNFIDKETLKQIQKVFLSMTPAEMKVFKDYLNGRKYLDYKSKNSPEHQIINKISKIALMSTPKDEYLKKIYTKYNQNLNEIDNLKIQTTKTIKAKEINDLIEQIHQLNEENVQLIEQVNAYREKKAS